VFSLSFEQARITRLRVFPPGKEILVGSTGFGNVAIDRVSPAEAEMIPSKLNGSLAPTPRLDYLTSPEDDP
jgi:hypothetical protein